MSRYPASPCGTSPSVGKVAGAWAQFSSTGAAMAIARSHNIASMTKTGTGQGSATYILPFASSGTAVVGSINSPTGLGFCLLSSGTITSTGCSFGLIGTVFTFTDHSFVTLAVFGHT